MTETTLKHDEAKALVEGLIADSETTRIQRQAIFNKYESFIDGEQWLSGEEKKGKEIQLTFNQSEDFLETYKAKIFPRNQETGILEIGVKVKNAENTEKEKYEREILDTYEKNKLPQIILEQVENFLVGGAGCLYYPYDPITNSAKIISLDPTTVFLGWNGNRLEQFAFEDEISLAEAEKNQKDSWLIGMIKKFLLEDKEATKRFKKAKRITYWNDQFQIINIGDNYEIRKNDKGIIPFSWIPNRPKSHQREGRSEIKKIYELDREYNFRQSDFGDRVRRNTKPTLATYSDKEAKDLDRDKVEDGILSLDKDDEAEFLKVEENPDILKYTENIAKRMSIKMGINDAVNGEIKSNVSSLSMTYYFSPLLDRIGLKRIFWDEAFRELNIAILTYKFGKGNYSASPVYQPIMQLDQETKIKNIVLMLENHLITYEDAIDQIHAGENSIEMFEKIKAEMKEVSQIEGFLKNSKPKEESEIKFV